jgi:uroporphyrinogen decarboxylase
LGLYFSEGEGPKFSNPIQSLADIEKLPININDKLTYVFDGVSTIKKALKHSVKKSPAFARVARYSGK